MSEKLDPLALWEETMKDLLSSVGTRDFARWFNLKFSDFSKDKLTLLAPSSLYVDQINARFPHLLESTIHKHFGNPTIQIHIDESILLKSSEPDKIAKNTGNIPQKSKEFEASVKSSAGALKHANTALPKPPSAILMREYTFDNYVIGENNDFAVNAALAVSRNPGKVTSYNPIFIYGGVGLGKTHLIQAIGNYVHDNSNLEVVYISAETFTNEFVESIGKQTTTAFKRKYRSADLLLIDDIHFLQKKDACQEELFNTFTALFTAKKQMVFTCDRPVTELKNFTERLSTRLGQGLQVDIQIPQYETRYNILQKKLETFNIQMPNEVMNEIIELICKNISTNIREMISALNNIVGYAELSKKEMTLELAKIRLKDIFASPKHSNISVDTIIQVIASHFNVSISDIKGRKRAKTIIYPRQLAMYIARSITNLSTTEIGQAFGKDHTTVIHAVEKIEKGKLSDPSEEGRIQEHIKLIKEVSVK